MDIYNIKYLEMISMKVVFCCDLWVKRNNKRVVFVIS